MKVKTITAEWLIENDSCVKGVNWFRRNYPKGVKITRKNIREAFEKLLSRRGMISDDQSTVYADTL